MTAAPEVLTAALEQAARHPAALPPPAVLAAVHVAGEATPWVGAHGRLDAAEDVPARADSPFRIASVTKAFVATACLRLVEAGELALTTPLVDLVPRPLSDLVSRGGYAVRDITLRHLLAHTSGLYDWGADPGYLEAVQADPARRWSREEQVRWAVDRGSPVGAPGERWHYSDTGYVLLGACLEHRTGRPYASALRELARLDELDLRCTWMESLEPVPASAGARLHQYVGGVDVVDTDPSIDLWGGGGLVSTVGDLAAFFRALLGGEVLQPQSLALMTTTPEAEGAAGKGHGLWQHTWGGTRFWGHTGYWGVAAGHAAGSGTTVAVCVSESPAFGGLHPDEVCGALVEAATGTGR